MRRGFELSENLHAYLWNVALCRSSLMEILCHISE